VDRVQGRCQAAGQQTQQPRQLGRVIAAPLSSALVSRLEEEPHRNPNTATMEFALRDPDGYDVMITAWPPKCQAVTNLA